MSRYLLVLWNMFIWLTKNTQFNGYNTIWISSKVPFAITMTTSKNCVSAISWSRSMLYWPRRRCPGSALKFPNIDGIPWRLHVFPTLLHFISLVRATFQPLILVDVVNSYVSLVQNAPSVPVLKIWPSLTHGSLSQPVQATRFAHGIDMTRRVFIWHTS